MAASASPNAFRGATGFPFRVYGGRTAGRVERTDSAVPDIDRRAETRETKFGRELGGLPHSTFRALGIAEKHVRAPLAGEKPRIERQANRGREPLAERAGRDVHEWKARRRMPFEIGADLSK